MATSQNALNDRAEGTFMSSNTYFTDSDLADLPPIISIEQASRLLGCSGRTVTRMCENGTLKHCRAGNRYRINRDALFAYAGLEVIR